MNFRNISSWCIRNPVPPIVLFIGLMLAGLVTFIGMQVNNNPDIDFPAATVDIVQPGAAPTEMETQVTQHVEAAVRGGQRRRRDQQLGPRRQQLRPSSSSRSARRPTARSTTCATRSPRSASDLPDGILEPQVTRIDIAGDPILYVARRDHRHEPRGAELVRRQ